ncbi:MAG: flavin monoamine oxidase family protein, partial [Vicinamibacterales bacterium]
MLQGVSVLVVGAGLAGLTAARDLIAMGAAVTVVDARDRVGGRVSTVRSGFISGQHAEAGADFIDDEHTELRRLVESLGLTLVQILRRGWAYARADEHGVVRPVGRDGARGWERLSDALRGLGDCYRLAERRWDTPISEHLARCSVLRWLDEHHADAELRLTVDGLRGFFLADADELSLLALVDQFAGAEQPVPARTYRVREGNDAIAAALAAPLGQRLRLGTELVAISQRGPRVRASHKHKRQS